MKKLSNVTTPIAVVALVILCQACGDETESDVTDPGNCVPMTCQERGWECGTIDDGCGNLISCGGCAQGYRCGLGSCHEICVPVCLDQCGGESNCPDIYCQDNCALTGRTCVNDGAVPMCQGTCVPRTCKSLGVECGTWDDWCGGTVDCGECLPGSNCQGGMCSEVPADGLGYNCDADPLICREPFPVCLKLTGEPAFCTRTCTGDGQCGQYNCCGPIKDDIPYCLPDGNQYLCANPVGNAECLIEETCLPSPSGACLFCFSEGEKYGGEECSGFNSCIAGQSCVKLAGEATSTCREICDPADGDACQGGETVRHCLALADLGIFGVCVDGPAGCTPSELGEDCPSNWNCIPDGAACTGFECAATGGQLVGESCAKHGNCARGGYCADGVCRELCSADAPCPANYECVQGCSTKIRYCAPVGGQACNPGASSNTCLADQTCLPTSTAVCTVGTCVQHGKTAQGGACATHSNCVAGTMCYDNYCMKTCGLTRACEPPSSCVFVCSNVDLGVCVFG